MEILLIKYGLAAVFLGGALEGDVTFTLAGVVVQLGLLHLPSAFAVGTLGALTGDCTWYWFGRSGSARIHNSRVYRRAEPIASRMASRFGAWEIFVARFIFGARTASCIFWGTRRLSFARFVVIDLIGCLTWVGLLITLGRLLSNSATALIGEVRRVELWLLGTLILSVSAFLILRIVFRHAIIANKLNRRPWAEEFRIQNMMASDWGRSEMIDNTLIDSAVEERVSARIAILIATRGPLSDRTFYLDEPVVSLGRLSSNDIVVYDLLVSRHHCVIRSDGEQHTIEDLNSSNGTYVNGERVRIASLKENSLIEIGASQFLFRVRNAEESIAPAQSLVVARNVSNSYDAIGS